MVVTGENTMLGLVVNQPSPAKENYYKSYRRRSSAFKGQGYILDPSFKDHVTTNETENENDESKNVSVVGLFLLAICLAYAIIISMICTYVFGWKTNPFCKSSRERALSKTAHPKTRSSSTCRKSISQG